MNSKGSVFRVAAGLLCVLFLVSFLFSMPVLSAQKKIIQVGWFLQPGYQEIDESGKPFGYNYEYLMRIAQYTGWEYEFVTVNSFFEGYEMLKSGELDILGYVLQTESRMKEVTFPDISSGEVSTSIFVTQDSPLEAYNFNEMDGISVACMESQNVSYLLEYSKENNFSVNFVYYENMQEVIEAVLSGEVDGGLGSGHQSGDSTRIIASFKPRPFYFAVNKTSSDILKDMNNALTNINLETPFYNRELSYKYLPQMTSFLNLTSAEKSYIETHPVIDVSYYPNWFPISTQDSSTGEFSGIARDVFDRISEITGLSFRYIPVVRESKEADNASIIAATVHNYNIAYDKNQRITNGYLNVPLVIVQSQKEETEISKTTALSYHLLDLVDCSAVENTQIFTYDTIQDSMDAVAKGAVDQTLLNAFASEYLLRQSKYKKLESLMLYNESYDVCIAVKNTTDEELYSILNKSIELISAADMNRIINQNTSRSLEINISTILSQMPVDVILLGGSGLIIIILLMMFIIFKQYNYSKKIKNILYTDDLTGALSFKGFLAQASNNISKNENSKAFIVDFDINHFGAYNNLNGYVQGNELLRLVATITKDFFYENELCGRIQADHFIGLAFDKDISTFKHRIYKVLDCFRKESGRNALLISYGIYEITDKKMNIIDMCDRALEAKNIIKGNYDRFISVYDESLHKKKLHEVEILERFDDAMSTGEFVHYFQPKYDIKTCQIVGAEALVRWIPPSKEIVMPGLFIELFERNGLIAKLDLHMFEKLCKHTAELLDQGLTPLPVSVNFSRVHLYDDGFAQNLIDIVNRYQVPASLLEIEITETAFVDNRKEMAKIVDLLHEAGFLISIDDFGSGFSSLNVLKDMDFDIIKLDRIFMDTIGNNEKGEIVISSVVTLAHQLELKIVAEGVETLSQCEMLRSCGCDIVQGYYFARPMPEAEYRSLYSK